MSFTPERRRRVTAALALLALVALAAPARTEAPAAVGQLIAAARRDLAKGDGIGAEVRLRRAVAAGVGRPEVAAEMGQALLEQGDRDKAREWLGPAAFAPGDEVNGLRMLGFLERLEGNWAAAASAYDRALKLNPGDGQTWVDIGRLRYAQGRPGESADMADRALQLAPHNPDALELAGELVRNQHGLEAALPWFEAGLAQAPDNFDLLGEYAATLGELGRARDMLRVTRKMLARDHRNPRALFLQAALAARAGKLELARRLLDLTNDRLSDVPSAMLLEGVLQLRAGNRNLAIDVLDRLTRLRPGNMPAALLLTRALAENGDSEQLVARFAGVAARPDAPAYLLILVGRAEEDLGHRDLAAPLLDRAAAAGAPLLVPLAEGQPLEALALTWRDSPDDAGASVAYVRKLIATGDLAHAEEVAERLRAASPGIAAAQIVAGDVQLLRGRQPAAIERYEQASIARSDDALLLRLVEADRRAGRGAAAVTAVESYLAQTPSSRIAVRLAAISTAESGDWRRARRLLEHLRDAGGQRDARLMSDLTLAQLRDGDPAAALVSARAAYRLQRSSPVATQALAMALAQQRGQARFAAALFDKALRIGGDNPLLTEGRRQLALLR